MPILGIWASQGKNAGISGIAGYNAGGGTNTSVNSYSTAITKVTYSNDSLSTLAATLGGSPGRSAAGFSNSGTAGYTAGGYNGAAGGSQSVINKLTYSNDSNSSGATTLSVVRGEVYSCSNTGTAGYAGGGYSTSGDVSSIDKILYSNDSRSTLSATLTTASRMQNGSQNAKTIGYFYGGSGLGNTVNTLTFSNDTVGTNATSLPSISVYASFADYGKSIYLFTATTAIYKHLLSNNTIASITATNPVSSSTNGACSNGNVSGYGFGGVSGTAGITTITKLLYSNETTSTLGIQLVTGVFSPFNYSNDGTV